VISLSLLGVVITRQIIASDGGRAGLAPARRYKSASTGGGTSFTQPAIAVCSLTPAAAAAASASTAATG
jgi:hypothetical protein